MLHEWGFRARRPLEIAVNFFVLIRHNFWTAVFGTKIYPQAEWEKKIVSEMRVILREKIAFVLREFISSAVHFDRSLWKHENFRAEKLKKNLKNCENLKSFKIHHINFLNYSALKLDQRMLSLDPAAANIKRWELFWYHVDRNENNNVKC